VAVHAVPLPRPRPTERRDTLRIVHPDLGYGPARLREPTSRGYIYIAAAVAPGRLPLVRPSRTRSRLLKELKRLSLELAAVGGVAAVSVFRAIARPPTGRFSSYLAARSTGRAAYDVMVLIQTISSPVARDVLRTTPYKQMVDAIRRQTTDMHVMLARNVKRLADVDATRPGGLFLFNHFVADHDYVMLELWEYLAAWYIHETGLRNSIAIAPVERQEGGYTLVNWARWDVRLVRHILGHMSKRSFWKFVVANLDANDAAAMPVYCRVV
jgi:hypothetical protein